MADKAKRVDIGGQAVLEGVMMRSPEYVALAVRRPDGSIVVKRDPYISPAKKHKWMGLPFIRGAVSMITMLGTGMKTLEESAKMSGETEEEPTKFELWLAEKLGKGVDKVVMGVAIVLAVALSLGLFVFLKPGERPGAHGAADRLYDRRAPGAGYDAGVPLSRRRAQDGV